MSRRVEFRLSMPSRGSWNGRWSGENRSYLIVTRNVPESTLAVLLPEGTGVWFHYWADGWGAQITGRVLEPGERAPKSDGFSGYDWMVANILDHGDTSDRSSAVRPVR